MGSQISGAYAGIPFRPRMPLAAAKATSERRTNMLYNKKSVEDIDVNGKRVLVRCDFNVPQDANQNITDDKRIVGAMPTIKYLSEHGA